MGSACSSSSSRGPDYEPKHDSPSAETEEERMKKRTAELEVAFAEQVSRNASMRQQRSRKSSFASPKTPNNAATIDGQPLEMTWSDMQSGESSPLQQLSPRATSSRFLRKSPASLLRISPRNGALTDSTSVTPLGTPANDLSRNFKRSDSPTRRSADSPVMEEPMDLTLDGDSGSHDGRITDATVTCST